MVSILNSIKVNTKRMLTFMVALSFSTLTFAEQLTPMKNGVDWLYKTLAWVSLTVLGLQIMFRLWQINQGQKEWSEVAKPILITGAIVAVPIAIPALTSAMGG